MRIELNHNIANGLWGKTQMYMVLMENDQIAIEALNYIEDAKETNESKITLISIHIRVKFLFVFQVKIY